MRSLTPLRADPRTRGLASSHAALPSAGLAFDVAALALAVAVKAFAPDPAWVERAYSNGAYPSIDRVVRDVTGPVPFCVGDLLFVAAAIALVALWTRALLGTHTPARRAGRALAALRRTLACAALAFVWFEASWAFNYGRIPVERKVEVHPERVTAAAVDALANRVVDDLNRDVAAAHREPLDAAAAAARIEPAFETVIARLGDTHAFAPPRIKPTVFQRFMELTGTSGFTDPWTHEVNVDAGAFFFERPALYAHEWGHIAGFADEAEANYVSALACATSGDALLRYSGSLLVWFNLPRTVHVTHRLKRQAFADIMAIRKRYLERTNARVAQAQRVAYNRYLKANRVAAGYASYQLFVRWLVGVDYDRSGLPYVRGESGAGEARSTSVAASDFVL